MPTSIWCLALMSIGLFRTIESQDRAPLDYYCDQPADIALLLDSSTYFKPLNFEEQKRFAESFITYFKLRQTRFGATIAVVPYSDKKIERSTIANFFYSRSIPFLTRKIKKLKFQGGKSKLEDALRFARDGLFVSKMGARTWVPRVVVAITGSWRTWGTWQTNEVRKVARSLRREGIKLMIAFVGSREGEEEQDRALFETMVESKRDLFMIRYTLGLKQVAKKMVQDLCPVPSIFPCPVTADIAFIVDSSNSIGPINYMKTKYFVYSIANALNISSTGAHAGVVLYSATATRPIKFTDYTDITSFKEAVYNLEYMGQNTRIDLGLQKAHTELFSPYYGGARPDVKKLAFILTDGKQNPKGDISLKHAAGKLINDGIKTISIGIGSEVDERELKSMVQYEEDVITVANFDELVRKIQNITQVTCEEIKYTKCQYPADIAFVLDSSTSVTYEDFAKMKGFVKTMAKLFRIFQHGSQGAVIVYGDTARVAIRMDEFIDYRHFVEAVDDLGRVGGRRRSFQAMALAEDVLSNYETGARRKVPKVLLMVTAGPESSNNDYNTLQEVTKRLHDRHTLVLAVGILPDANIKELQDLVQSSVNVFAAQSFQQLSDQLVPLSNETCKNVGPGYCAAKVDVVFILDSSGSISEDEFLEAKNFVKRVAKTFEISPEKTHTAVMIYSDEARIVKKFGEIKSTDDFNSNIDDLPHLRGKTRIDLALSKAGKELFTWAGGMRIRSDVIKVAIVITDGRQSPAPDGIRLDEAASSLIVQGVKVLSIGIGDNIDQEELRMMVQDPDRHTFWSESYTALRVQLATIARESCSLPVYTE